MSKNKLLLLDWDDTCLPSTYLSSLSEYKLDNCNERSHVIQYLTTWQANLHMFKMELDILESYILSILDICSTQGVKCIIVSCALQCWVEETCQLVFPNLWLILKARNIPIVSARFPVDQCTAETWKEKTFRHILSSYEYTINEAISIGDSLYDRFAVQEACNESSIVPKSILMLSDPNVLDLNMQWEELLSHFNYILNDPSSVDLKLRKDTLGDQIFKTK